MGDRIRVEDVEAVLNFRARLMAFDRELAEGLAAVRGHWHELGSVWTDEMYHRLGEALAEVTPGIDRYLAAAEGHEAYLLELYRRLRAVQELSGG